ncbi:nickel/cobalt homeostasis protein RcnB precursor [mine drainage metagenome]|uniref:Nickel/cobalt homeostasis protein RcnB n=1 Tax=mine drainage metagenome TaxID=410659 RepID=A0A1J5QGS5_9ZZZZ
MSHKSVLNIALSLALATSGSVFAQGNSQHQRYNNDCRNNNCSGPDNQQRSGRNARRSAPPQQQERNDWHNQYHRATRDERGAGPDRSFRQGGRLPPEYRSRQYVVDDWRGHHLSAPPRGYHWVQNGSDYLLVAITTGIIMQLLLSN